MTLPGDFYYPNIDYPDDAYGNPRYAEPDPRHPSFQRLTNWFDLGPNGYQLRHGDLGGDITWVYTHPFNWRVWHLSGPREGREGVALATDLDGVMDPDYEIKYQSGTYVVGAEPERVDYPMREIHMGFWIAGHIAGLTGPFRYLMTADAFRQSWSETVPGYLGCFNRVHGWRWLQVLKGKGAVSGGATKHSPTAFGNNAELWNIVAHAPYPMYAKRALTATWKSSAELVTAGDGVAHGKIAIANRGTWRNHPKFIITGRGNVSIQDGIGGKMVKLPEFYDSDGAFMMVDTDPTRQTIVTANEPVDDGLAKFLRNSQLLEAMFHDQVARATPAQRRVPGGVLFDNPIPARTVAHLNVEHDNPQGTVTCILPQHYRTAWS